MMALLVRVYKTDMLWDLNAFRLVGEIIGGIMGGCSVMKLEDLGSFMTDQQVISRAKLLSSKE